jgi:hypothetical protein
LRGYAQDISPAHGGYHEPYERQVVGVVCSSSFPDPELVKTAIQRGQAHDPDTVWVVRRQDKVAEGALQELGLDYLPLALNPYWKMPEHDVRRIMREQELMSCCSMIVVFTTPDALKTTMRAFGDKVGLRPIRVIERGKPKPKKRHTRKAIA